MLPNSKTQMDTIHSGLNLISQAISIHNHDLELIHANHRMQTMFQLPQDLVAPGTHFRDVVSYLAVRGEYGALVNIDEFVDGKGLSMAR